MPSPSRPRSSTTVSSTSRKSSTAGTSSGCLRRIEQKTARSQSLAGGYQDAVDWQQVVLRPHHSQPNILHRNSDGRRYESRTTLLTQPLLLPAAPPQRSTSIRKQLLTKVRSMSERAHHVILSLHDSGDFNSAGVLLRSKFERNYSVQSVKSWEMSQTAVYNTASWMTATGRPLSRRRSFKEGGSSAFNSSTRRMKSNQERRRRRSGCESMSMHPTTGKLLGGAAAPVGQQHQQRYRYSFPRAISVEESGVGGGPSELGRIHANSLQMVSQSSQQLSQSDVFINSPGHGSAVQSPFQISSLSSSIKRGGNNKHSLGSSNTLDPLNCTRSSSGRVSPKIDRKVSAISEEIEAQLMAERLYCHTKLDDAADSLKDVCDVELLGRAIEMHLERMIDGYMTNTSSRSKRRSRTKSVDSELSDHSVQSELSSTQQQQQQRRRYLSDCCKCFH